MKKLYVTGLMILTSSVLLAQMDSRTISSAGTNGTSSWTIGQLISSTSDVSTGVYSHSIHIPESFEEAVLNFQKSNLEITIFPNPVVKELHIKSEQSTSAISAMIFDLKGTKILERGDTNQPINVSTLSSGTYLLQLTQNTQTIQLKFVKN